MSKEPEFLGTGWGFPPTFNRSSSSVEMTSGVKDIEQSLGILFRTKVGERVMQARYGAQTDDLVFEPINTTLLSYMADLFETAILYFEPRITLNNLEVVPTSLEGRVEINVDYTVTATNTRYNFVYPYYITEGTEIGADFGMDA